MFAGSRQGLLYMDDLRDGHNIPALIDVVHWVPIYGTSLTATTIEDLEGIHAVSPATETELLHHRIYFFRKYLKQLKNMNI